MQVIINAHTAALHVPTPTDKIKREDGTFYIPPSTLVNLKSGVSIVSDEHWDAIRGNPTVAQRLANGDLRELVSVKSERTAIADAGPSGDTIIAQCYDRKLAAELLDGERARKTPSRQRVDALKARVELLETPGQGR